MIGQELPKLIACCSIIISAISLLIVPVNMQAQVTINTTVQNSPGISLLTSSSPEFAHALSPDRALAGDVLLPYAVLLKNGKDLEIFAYSIVWTLVDSSGKVSKMQTTKYNLQTFAAGTGILAHSARIVSFVNGLGTPLLQEDEAFKERVNEMAARYRDQVAIMVSLDAVIFRNGLARGPDPNEVILRIKGQIDAERDLVREIVGSPEAEIPALLSRIAQKAFSQIPESMDGTPKRSRNLAVYVSFAQDYQKAYILAQGNLAAQMLETLKTVSVADAVKSVQALAAGKKYPDILTSPEN